MSPRNAAERKAAERARKRVAGLKPHEVWMTAKEYKAVKKLLGSLRK